MAWPMIWRFRPLRLLVAGMARIFMVGKAPWVGGSDGADRGDRAHAQPELFPPPNQDTEVRALHRVAAAPNER